MSHEHDSARDGGDDGHAGEVGGENDEDEDGETNVEHSVKVEAILPSM